MSTSRKQPQQQRSRERVDRILSATEALLAEQPPNSLTVRQVAQRANVSAATIYQFFSGREDLIEAVVERLLVTARELVSQLSDEAAETGDWARYSNQLVSRLHELQRDSGGFFCIARTPSDDPTAGPLAQRLRQELQELLYDSIAGARPDLGSATRQIVNFYSRTAILVLADLPHADAPERRTELEQAQLLLASYLAAALN